MVVGTPDPALSFFVSDRSAPPSERVKFDRHAQHLHGDNVVKYKGLREHWEGGNDVSNSGRGQTLSEPCVLHLMGHLPSITSAGLA